MAVKSLTTLNKNLDELENTILNFKEKQLGLPTIDFDKFFFTKRQAAKKAIMLKDETIAEEDAHFIVYGKKKYDDNGKLSDNEKTDPDCVDPNYGFSDDHDIIEGIKKKFKEFKKSVKMFMINAAEFIKSIPGLISSIITQLGSAIPAMTALPAGVVGPANVLVMFKSLITAISEFLAKITTILLVIEPFADISFLMPDNLIDSFVSPINVTLTSLNETLSMLSMILGLILTVSTVIP